MIVAKDHLGNTEATGTISTGRDAARSARALARSRSSILIVDDDADLARRYQRALESYGYAVERAAHGEAAIRLASEKRFDVVVGDVDPRESCEDRTLKSIHDQCKEVPVVLLSNVLAFASARAAVECGAYRYLLKPVSDERLLEVLVETIQETSRLWD
jgi:DNA-binding NtrC family response regulator